MRIRPDEAREAIHLHRRMNALLAQMATLPYGSTMNYNASGGGRSSEHPGGRRPGGEARSVEDEFRARWNGCRTIVAARVVVREAEAELDHWRRAKKPAKEESEAELHADIRKRRGWSDREVADAMRLPMSKVHEARLKARCCPAKGLPFQGCSAVELANRGNSIRQIGEMLKIANPATVHRMLRKAA
jgi:hypothetical protein